MMSVNRTMTRNIISIHLGVSRVLANEIVEKVSDEDCIKISSMKVQDDIAGAIQDVVDGKGGADESSNADSKTDEKTSPEASASVEGLDPRAIDEGVDEDDAD